MSVKRKKILPSKAETENGRYSAYEWCKSEVQRMRQEGIYDGEPEQWHPAARLVRLAEDPACTPSLKFLCLKTLLEYVEMPKAAEVRTLAGDNAETTIHVSVASWAAAPRMGGAPKAIEVVATTDVLAGNAEIQECRGLITTLAMPDGGRAAPIEGGASSFQEYEMAKRK